MDTTTYVALSRQTSLWNQMSVVANNLANSETIGFKGERALFTEYVVRSPSDDRTFRDKIAYTQDFGLVRNLEQGSLVHTNNPLDIALEDEGYFSIDTAEGVRYTRDGRFTLSQEGAIVDTDGNPLLSTAGTPIFIAPGEGDINIRGDGTVYTEFGEIGKIRVVAFEDERELKKVGGALFDAEDQFPEEIEFPRLAQGAIENSNVNAIDEITRLIDLNRAYAGVNQMINIEHERKRNALQTWTRRVSA